MVQAVLIGINYTGTNNALDGCGNDVKNYLWLFRTKFGLKNDVLILSDVPTISALNTQPSAKYGLASFKPIRSHILTAFKLLSASAKAGKTVLLSYSGHGSNQHDPTGKEADGRNETLVPLDHNSSGVITDDIVRAILIDPLPRKSRLIAFFDCCHSGTMADLRFNFQCTPSRQVGTWIMREDDKFTETAAQVIVVSGCLDSQQAADASEGGIAQGALTWAVCKVFRDRPGQPKITCQLFLRCIAENLMSHNYPQKATLSSGQQISLIHEYL